MAHTILQQTQNDDNTHSVTIQVPDYPKSSCQALFNEGLKYPVEVSTDPVSGNIAVSDGIQYKVFILTDTLQLVHSFGLEGEGPGKYTWPWAVTIYDDKLYICDTNKHRICVTDTQGAFLYTFGSEGTGREHYSCPSKLLVDSHGLLYVCDSRNHRIKVTDRDGTYVREFGQDVFTDDCPWYIAVSAHDRVAVTNSNGDIHLFTTKGQYLHRIVKGKTQPHNILARGVRYDNQGNLLVSDWNGGRVVVMSDQGEVKCFIGSKGADPGQLSIPWDVSVTRNGGVVVCDNGNARMQLFHVPNKSNSI